jgi:ketosteroid isomerase-like protein
MQPAALVLAFVDAINTHDVPRIVAMCTQDHQFIDAYGNIVAAERLHEAWTGYFSFMPSYGIEIETVLADGDLAAVFGTAWGNLGGERAWRRPAAWRARVQGGLIQLWQVYVDTKAVFDFLQGAP